MRRREFLQTGGVLLAGIGTAATAGCSRFPFVGSSGPGYTAWLYAPDEVPELNERYYVTKIEPKTLYDNGDAFDDRYLEAVESQYSYGLSDLGVDFETVESGVFFNWSAVYTVAFDEDDVAENLRDMGFEAEEDVGGFTVYAPADDESAWALGSERLVFAPAVLDLPAQEHAEAVVETKTGSADRYVDEVDMMDDLTSTLDDGFTVWANPFDPVDVDEPESGEFENSVGRGYSHVLNGDTVEVKRVTVFEDADDVVRDDFEDYVEADADSELDHLENVAVETSGPAGIVTGEMPADSYGV